MVVWTYLINVILILKRKFLLICVILNEENTI